MTDKRIIDSFIGKYHLGGNIERTKWVSDGESLKADFINDSQNLVGKVVSKKFKFPIGEFGIYSTSTLSKMLGILENEVMFEIINFKESLKHKSFVDISKPTGVKNIQQYTAGPPLPGNIFSTFENKAPVGGKAAVRYNDLLKFKNLDKKHTQIVEGDKIKWVYLKDNPYKIDTIGFLDFDLPEKIQEFIKEYVDVSKSFDTILKNKLESFYQDLEWGELNFNTYNEWLF